MQKHFYTNVDKGVESEKKIAVTKVQQPRNQRQ